MGVLATPCSSDAPTGMATLTHRPKAPSGDTLLQSRQGGCGQGGQGEARAALIIPAAKTSAFSICEALNGAVSAKEAYQDGDNGVPWANGGEINVFVH